MRFLPVDRLEAGMILAQDVYVDDNATHAFLRRGFELTWAAIDRLLTRGVARVAIAGPEEVPDARARPKTTQVFAEPPLPLLDEALRQEALTAIERAFSDVIVSDEGIIGTPETFGHMDEVVEKLVRTLMGNKGAFVNISDLKSFDDYTYHHSLAVAVLSIGVGQQMGLRTRELNRLGVAAIMHDIGKTSIPVDIIRKPARLSPQEFDLIKSHAQAGTRYMISSSVGDAELWKAVLFHHERLDGTGYPNGLSGSQIPLYARVISVADVYDALTSSRPYRQALPPGEAQEYIMGGVNSAFDFDVVAALVAKVALYPVGAVVELSNRQLAVVLDNDNARRPIVELVATGEVVDLFRDRKYLNVVVKRMLDEGEITRIAR